MSERRVHIYFKLSSPEYTVANSASIISALFLRPQHSVILQSINNTPTQVRTLNTVHRYDDEFVNICEDVCVGT